MIHFIDTAVIMFAAGRPHPLKEPCVRVLHAVADGTLEATTSAEVVQEILHRFAAGDRDQGDRMARETLRAFYPVLPVDHETVERARALMARHATLHARDAIHAGTCERHGITRLVSPDTDFDVVAGLTRVAPTTLA